MEHESIHTKTLQEMKSMLSNVDDDSDDESSRAEGLRLLLGNDIALLLDSSAWDNESVHSDVDNITVDDKIATGVQNTRHLSVPAAATTSNLPLQSSLTDTENIAYEKKNDFVFTLAYTRNENVNNPNRPMVAIFDFGPEKGNGLISLQDFNKGAVIYTERAAIATPADDSSPVTCCFNCFQSMEYITICQGLLKKKSDELTTYCSLTNGTNTVESSYDISGNTEFPCPSLWPILPLTWIDTQGNDKLTNKHMRVDIYGRQQCNNCMKFFCSAYCTRTFIDELGPCCHLSQIVSCIPEVLGTCVKTKNPIDVGELSDSDADTGDVAMYIQCEVLLAVRMFAHELQAYRRRISNGNINISFLTGLCGDDSDLNDLQIGIGSRLISDDGNVPDVTLTYTLEPIYKQLVNTYALNQDEQLVLPYSKLVLFAVQAARNGFGITPQSPFQTYYSSLVRVSGRGTPKHKKNVEQVTAALGVVKLDRKMDAIIDQRVVSQVAAIFPLTARINHACSPNFNAEVRCGQFVNYNIDLVATRDMKAGEEILISYIEGSHRKRRNTRQRELYARYLFKCKCFSCRIN
jgi:SET domain